MRRCRGVLSEATMLTLWWNSSPLYQRGVRGDCFNVKDISLSNPPKSPFEKGGLEEWHLYERGTFLDRNIWNSGL